MIALFIQWTLLTIYNCVRKELKNCTDVHLGIHNNKVSILCHTSTLEDTCILSKALSLTPHLWKWSYRTPPPPPTQELPFPSVRVVWIFSGTIHLAHVHKLQCDISNSKDHPISRKTSFHDSHTDSDCSSDFVSSFSPGGWPSSSSSSFLMGIFLNWQKMISTYYELLDNYAIPEFSMALPSWVRSHFTMVYKIWKAHKWLFGCFFFYFFGGVCFLYFGGVFSCTCWIWDDYIIIYSQFKTSNLFG